MQREACVRLAALKSRSTADCKSSSSTERVNAAAAPLEQLAMHWIPKVPLVSCYSVHPILIIRKEVASRSTFLALIGDERVAVTLVNAGQFLQFCGGQEVSFQTDVVSRSIIPTRFEALLLLYEMSVGSSQDTKGKMSYTTENLVILEVQECE